MAQHMHSLGYSLGGFHPLIFLSKPTAKVRLSVAKIPPALLIHQQYVESLTIPRAQKSQMSYISR
jgi:hypothetical protein